MLRQPAKFMGPLCGALMLAAALAAPAARAQDRPSKPIRMIIAFPPGQTSSDVSGRAMADRLGKTLGQSVVVENRPGAGGTVGADLIAKARPGTLNVMSSGNGTTPHPCGEWFERQAGILTPAKTPRPIVDRLYREITRIMAAPEMQTLVSTQAGGSMAQTQDEFAARIKDETALWARIADASRARLD